MLGRLGKDFGKEGASVKAGSGSGGTGGGGASTAGQPIGLLLALTKAS